MWFIKTNYWNEFQNILINIKEDNKLKKSILIVREAEKFCKQGKGKSFYKRTVYNNKLLVEIEKFREDSNFQEFKVDFPKL